MILGAAEYGRGRVLVITQDGYSIGFPGGHSDVNVNILQNNILNWLSRNTAATVCELNNALTYKNLSKCTVAYDAQLKHSQSDLYKR